MHVIHPCIIQSMYLVLLFARIKLSLETFSKNKTYFLQKGQSMSEMRTMRINGELLLSEC